MKTLKEIKEEVKFQESEYIRIKAIAEAGCTSEQLKQEYYIVMGRHAARRQVLNWVIGA